MNAIPWKEWIATHPKTMNFEERFHEEGESDGEEIVFTSSIYPSLQEARDNIIEALKKNQIGD